MALSKDTIIASEMTRLWQAHGIVELAVHAIGDEVDNGAPSIKQPLRAAADIIFASIEALEAAVSSAAEVSHGE